MHDNDGLAASRGKRTQNDSNLVIVFGYCNLVIGY
jgi:hypothetical protein